MSRNRAAFPIAAILLALMTVSALAHSPLQPMGLAGGMREAEQVLQQTDQVLERARDHLREAASIQRSAVAQQAEVFFEKGLSTQRDAHGDFRRQRYAQAISLSMKAREYALKTIELSQVEFKAHESLATLLEQTREMAVEAKSDIRESGNPEAERLLNTAEDQLRRAHEAYRDKRLRQSIRLAVVSRDLIRRALDTVHGSGPDEIGRIGSALDQTDGLLIEVDESLREGLGGGELEALARRAKEVQDRARRAYREGRPKQAFRLTHIAREHSLAVLLHLQSSPNRQDLEASLSLLSSLYESIQSAAENADDESIAGLISRGRDHLRSARRAMESGKMEQALKEARVSEALLREASERIPAP